MNTNRRDFLKASSVFGLMVAAGLVTMEDALAQAAGWNKAAFDAKTMAESIKAMGGAMPTQSADIAITAPDIAENGAVVPVGVTSKIPDTQAIYLFVEKNPSALTAGFNLPAGTEPTVSTRIKMGQTSNVTAVVKADNKYYFTTKEVKVTLGGCGG
ncbi:MAG: thiosulfate oxidation carrier protein SoxY [Burkholderiaceae bacterium]